MSSPQGARTDMNDRSTSRPGARRRRPRRLASLGLLAIVGVLAAGCGGGDTAGGKASAADRERQARDAALKYARCMREHGVDVPDPVFDGGGINQTGPEEKVPKAKLQQAERACRRYAPKEVEGPQLSEEEQREFREAALANARCMREHGIENFPDPTFPGSGEAAIQAPAGAFDPNDPDFKEAEEACKDTLAKPPSAEATP
jgi:hypothetical protein